MNGEIYAARSANVAARKLGGEMMIIASGGESVLFTLDEVATALWEALDGVTPLDEIVRRKVCEEFAVEQEEAYRDAKELIDGLAQHGLVLVSQGQITAHSSPPQVQH